MILLDYLGSKGFEAPIRLAPKELELMTQEYSGEFALIYKVGPYKNGGGGDRSVLELLEAAGSPQRPSQIIPVGDDVLSRFNKDRVHVVTPR